MTSLCSPALPQFPVRILLGLLMFAHCLFAPLHAFAAAETSSFASAVSPQPNPVATSGAEGALRSYDELTTLLSELRRALHTGVSSDPKYVNGLLDEIDGELASSRSSAESMLAISAISATGKKSKSSKSSSTSSELSAALASQLQQQLYTIQAEASSCQRELVRANRVVVASRQHQATEVEKLRAVRRGVENLLQSLKGTQKNLMDVKRESSEMAGELSTLQKQAVAAAQLEKDISEIQEHARVNYETGELELSGKGAFSAHLSDGPGSIAAAAGHGKITAVDPAIMHFDPRLLLDTTVLLGAAAFGGMLAARLSLPHIIGYLCGGVFVGPSGLGLIQRSVVQVETLAQFGSVFFLFGHGLEYSLNEQRKFTSVSVGGSLLSTAVITVVIQVTVLLSGVVTRPLEAALLGLSMTLSSLSVVLDHIHSHKLVQSTHAKVMVGMLGFQGLTTGLFFSIPPALALHKGEEANTYGILVAALTSLGSVVFVCGVAVGLTRFVLPRFFESLTMLGDRAAGAYGEELYLLGVVSVAMAMSLLTESLGLSLDLGAFFAGIMMSELKDTPRTVRVTQPLSSIFGAMLFASLGMIINPEFFWKNFDEILVIAVQLVVVKALVICFVVHLFDFSWRTSLLCGVGLSHVGEFSLLFSSKLQAHNLVSRRAYLLFLAATVTTLALAPLVLRLLAWSKFVQQQPFLESSASSLHHRGGGDPHHLRASPPLGYGRADSPTQTIFGHQRPRRLQLQQQPYGHHDVLASSASLAPGPH